VAAIRSQPAEICGSKRPLRARGSVSNRSRPMQGTRNEKIKSLQTMRKTIKEKSSPTTATSSGQDIQAHVAQSDGDITAPIRPWGKANVGPTGAVQPSSRPIRRPRTPPPRPARHQRDPTATATKGHKTMPFDPFEIGHAASYFVEHIAGETSVDPQPFPTCAWARSGI